MNSKKLKQEKAIRIISDKASHTEQLIIKESIKKGLK